MSVVTISNAIERLQKEIADISKKISQESKKESDLSSKVIQLSNSINKNSSASTVKSKLSDIARKQSEIAKIQGRKADLLKKEADKSAKLLKAKQELTREEEKQRKKLQQAETKQRKESLDFQKKLRAEIESSVSESKQKIREQTLGKEVEYDIFISHASEDKDELVRPLAEALIKKGASVWYDEFTLKVGDSLRKSIDHGLAKSRFGTVVLSNAFFKKNWTEYELNGMVAREMNGHKMILPIWHMVSKDKVLSFSPTLADKVALNSSILSIEEIADALLEVING